MSTTLIYFIPCCPTPASKAGGITGVAPTVLLLSDFFSVLREWMGLENLLYMFYDDPQAHRGYDGPGALPRYVMVARRVLKDLRVDFVRFWEDMAYKSGP